jgi:dTDP-4-dehydrorhamnose reductase
VAGRGAVSRYDWARAVLRLDPRREEHVAREVVPVMSSEFPTPARRPACSALDCALFESTFGVRVDPWEQALQEAMAA